MKITGFCNVCRIFWLQMFFIFCQIKSHKALISLFLLYAESLLSSLQLDGNSHCSLQLNLTFYSLLDSEDESLNKEEKEEEEEEQKKTEFDPILRMQHHFQRIATSLKHKVRKKRK